MLITGEVDRTTDFEHGMPHHEAWRDGHWEPDPLSSTNRRWWYMSADEGWSCSPDADMPVR